MDLSEEAAKNPHAKSRFHLCAAPGAPVNPGASAYDSTVLRCGGSGCYGFPECGQATSLVQR
eukprot:7133251-Alexandrium_andersonii.AAC.1